MVPDIALVKNKQQLQLPNINSATPSPGSIISTSSPESLSSSSPSCPGRSESASSFPSSPENFSSHNSNTHHHNSNDYSSNHHIQRPPRPYINYHRLSTNKLPVCLVKSQLLDRIQKNETLIIIGETGSGKTTQIPQFLYEHLISSKFYQPSTLSNRNRSSKETIAITQPRRVAAVSVAQRVAKELQCQIGDLVGYKIRFDDCTSHNTRIKYMTDGMLLREAISDPLLSNYRVIILDEAHERTVQSDLLFGIVKQAQRLRSGQKRPLDEDSGSSNDHRYHEPLKIIIMSATMDVDNFSRYFNQAPVIYIEGRVHPIEIFYTESKQTDYVAACLTTLFQIHQEEDELTVMDEQTRKNNDFIRIGGDVLVFCTGQEEIENMIKIVQNYSAQTNTMKTSRGTFKTLKAYPLYSALPKIKQQRIFDRNPNDCFRRVIFATNIAETSITIPNIRYVIDTGKFKSKFFLPKTGFEIMRVENISKAQACQRSGRAGRLAPGKCYRLYTRPEYRSFTSFPVPEIQKCSISTVLLQLIALGVSNVQAFDFIDSPSAENIESSLKKLMKMKAIEKVNDSDVDYKLTKLGQTMVMFPIDPRYALLLIKAQKFRCTEEIITIIAMLSVDNVFDTSMTDENAIAIHRKFASSEGDLIKLLNVFRRYREAQQKMTWCQENYLRAYQLKQAEEIRQQLVDLCKQAYIDLVSTPSTENVRKCLAIASGVGVGLGANIAELQRDGDYRTITFGQNDRPSMNVFIHPSSCLFSQKPECIMFVELVQTNKSYMRNLCLIDRKWLIE
ncbi:putative ATP-dependent RNA helicase dhx33 [Dermatophagoides pteronyssinus]|uniref:RNA helicase n=1 Tax=Dermatophagoides pteronyssinus TaxID=6956 RepID=A0ABQ8J5G7_DERPT|nr:putative ATP-dependent RNA helicase dhx33 [Dermatophagoides pteronyssinus]